MAKCRSVTSLCLFLLLTPALFRPGCCGGCPSMSEQDDFTQTYFNGTRFVQLECSARGKYVHNINISVNTQVLVFLSTHEENTCQVIRRYGACNFSSGEISAKVLLTDIQKEEGTNYTCLVSRTTSSNPDNKKYCLTLPEKAVKGAENPGNPHVGEKGGASAEKHRNWNLPPDLDSMSCRSGVTDKSFYYATQRGGGRRGREGEGMEMGMGMMPYHQDTISSRVPTVPAPEKPGGQRSVMDYQRPFNGLSAGTMTLGRTEKHRNRNLPPDLDSMSCRSGVTDKSLYYATQRGGGRRGREGEGMEIGMGMMPYHLDTISSHVPTVPAPEKPGGQRSVMDYQCPFNGLSAGTMTLGRTDARRILEDTVQYQEPWGIVPALPRVPPNASSTLQRFPNHRLVKVQSFDATASSAAASLPVPPPTQETGA
ncbi:hypothetical protein ACOMHN_025559 [Nucella lapillus]